MRDLLLTICPYAMWILFVSECVLLYILGKGYHKTKKKMYLYTFLVTCGLVFDALILSLGVFLKPGDVFARVSQVRYITHGVLVPVLLLICAEALHVKPSAYKIFVGITLVLMIAGVYSGFANVLEVKEIAGIVRYASSKELTSKLVRMISSLLSFGTVIPLIVVGVRTWKQEHTPTLFLSGLLMFAFSALGPATGNADLIFFISMFGECFMILFLLLYARREG